ncbi:pyridoxamine 5'-phosphate oxidase family protein [Paenibacillus chartarius]|uniref:Pyridoxamine 5'-phosphate oxidase family protein n=1 Tax=Paenibacillus chartarius TaxID=747481 RepID=A0ABV6DUI9_9BACL
MAEVVTALSQQLIEAMRKEKLILLGSIDAETGGPAVSALSWVYAMDEGRVRFALDARSRLIAALKDQPQVTLTLIGEGSVHVVYGRSAFVTEQLEGVPFALACVEVSVQSVRDGMFYGARIVVEPEYEKTYDKRAAEKLDGQVFAAMKKA